MEALEPMCSPLASGCQAVAELEEGRLLAPADGTSSLGLADFASPAAGAAVAAPFGAGTTMEGSRLTGMPEARRGPGDAAAAGTPGARMA
mmetsp:Transcript_116790/g.376949  ORF Transcript_116790/g.376949 Transcript_116790/m.376949 type:complete len:90 (+) Transcript_116790:2646-2915(+)